MLMQYFYDAMNELKYDKEVVRKLVDRVFMLLDTNKHSCIKYLKIFVRRL